MEPESASLYCRSMRAFRETSSKDKPKLMSLPPGSVYMLVDCGGKLFFLVIFYGVLLNIIFTVRGFERGMVRSKINKQVNEIKSKTKIL